MRKLVLAAFLAASLSSPAFAYSPYQTEAERCGWKQIVWGVPGCVDGV